MRLQLLDLVSSHELAAIGPGRRQDGVVIDVEHAGKAWDIQVSWTVLRAVRAVGDGNEIELTIEEPRAATLRVYPRQNMLFGVGMRRRYSWLLEQLWPDDDVRPFHRAHQIDLPTILRTCESIGASLEAIRLSGARFRRLRNATVFSRAATVDAALDALGVGGVSVDMVTLGFAEGPVSSIEIHSDGRLATNDSLGSPQERFDAISQLVGQMQNG